MDRALDEVIGERQRNRNQGARPRRNDRGRDSYRKNTREGRAENRHIDDDWLHDKFDDEDDVRGSRRGPRPPTRNRRAERGRESPEPDLFDQSVRLRVENLHYDLTEEDLEELFNRIAPVVRLNLTYDRAGRSLGLAYVTYRSLASARSAIREFDGANANGQPIRLSLVPSAPSAGTERADRQDSSRDGSRNPFDTAVKPSRSLFERIQEGDSRRGGGSDDRGSRGRSRSPNTRRSDVSKPAPDNIDRYIPGSRSRSPPARRRPQRGSPRRDGSARGGGRGQENGRRGNTRPRMTQEQLDQDMDNYFNKAANGDSATTNAGSNINNTGNAGRVNGATPSAAAGGGDGDIDMAE